MLLLGIIYKELITTCLEAENEEEALRKVGAMFLAGGFVKETYIDAVVEREKIYPTGINLKGISLAMPHTDKSHVHKSAIAIALLKEPVTFMHMGSTGEKVRAEIIFMMSIDDPEEQIDNLKRVMRLFMNQDMIQAFKSAANTEALYALAKQNLDEKEEGL